MVKAKFLSAVDGNIVVTIEDGHQLVMSSSEDVAHLADLVDFSTALCSSSMDFADEYGFSNSTAAWDIFNRGLEMSKGDQHGNN